MLTSSQPTAHSCCEMKQNTSGQPNVQNSVRAKAKRMAEIGNVLLAETYTRPA